MNPPLAHRLIADRIAKSLRIAFKTPRGWESEVQRLVLALAVTATMLCCGSATRAQVVICPPLPPWYPRGWELMVRYPCVTYVYGPSCYSPAYYPYPAYPHQRERVHRGHICVPAGGGEDREASIGGDGGTTIVRRRKAKRLLAKFA